MLLIIISNNARKQLHQENTLCVWLGNAKTLMFANINPVYEYGTETLSTLRYAARVKNIKNKPVVNIDPKDALLNKMKEEIGIYICAGIYVLHM